MVIEVKQRKRVTNRARASRKARKLEAAEGPPKHPGYLPEELAGMYRPVKRPVTLRLDADVLAWFQRFGRGYQTRINLALRRVMIAERKKAR
jgi:uncharacterized protein (DUF4415 family)